jgi:FMN-dependent NADH-azoreductase
MSAAARHREITMTLFRLDASIRTQGSVTRQVADTVEAAWRAAQPDQAVVRRDIGRHPLPAQAWSSASIAGRVAPEQRSTEQAEAVALAATLADELVDADSYVFAVPLYNFGVAAHFKTWVDLVVTDPRFGPGAPRLIEGRPAVLVTAKGGGYGAGTPREGWDHSTPWLRRILADVFGLDLRLVEAELTLADVNPAMEALRPLAAQSLREAHDLARVAGAALAQGVGQAA